MWVTTRRVGKIHVVNVQEQATSCIQWRRQPASLALCSVKVAIRRLATTVQVDTTFPATRLAALVEVAYSAHNQQAQPIRHAKWICTAAETTAPSSTIPVVAVKCQSMCACPRALLQQASSTTRRISGMYAHQTLLASPSLVMPFIHSGYMHSCLCLLPCQHLLRWSSVTSQQSLHYLPVCPASLRQLLHAEATQYGLYNRLLAAMVVLSPSQSGHSSMKSSLNHFCAL